MDRANDVSTSLSYIKPSVVEKNGASPDTILRMCFTNNFGSFSVKFSWKNWISISMTALWLKEAQV